MARDLLRRPPPCIPVRKNIAGLTAAARRHGLDELLEKHLLSGFLLTPGNRQEQWRLPAADIFRRRFPDTDWATLLTVPWIHVPIIAVQGGNGRFVTMMIGRLAGRGCLLVSAGERGGELPCIFEGDGYPHPLRHLDDFRQEDVPKKEKITNLEDALLCLKTAIRQVERFM